MKNIIPQHIGLILDGNRRWAKARGLSSLHGHKNGFDNLRTISRHAFKRGVKILTVYAFSTENWSRSHSEVTYLLRLFHRLVTKELRFLMQDDIRLNIFGDKSRFSAQLQQAMKIAEKSTQDNQQGILNICLNYGGQDEIIMAIKSIIKDKIGATKITKQLVEDYLYSAGQPHPDLIIRTSGEQRLSNFLTWQSVYSELYFSPKNWPSFKPKDLDGAIISYSRRQRRFGA